jgi:hypothetical protein
MKVKLVKDVKVTCWTREWVTVEANSVEEAKQKALKDENCDSTDFEVLYDTIEPTGDPIEIYHQKEQIKFNQDDEDTDD